MPSFKHRIFALAVLVLGLAICGSQARAQLPPFPAPGFAVERFYPSAPGGGWLVMDSLDMHGGLGGVMGLTVGYAHNPLLIANGSESLAVVSHQAFADFGFAITYSRFRLALNLDVPLAVRGMSGTVGFVSFTGPSVDPAANPDTVSDARIAFDARIVGEHDSRFRLGLGAQLIVPNGNRSDYITDGTFRAMGRVLFAGDVGLFTYAGHVGVHIRPLDESQIPGSPNGSELLLGVAGGAKLPVGHGRNLAVIIGPEVFGVTAFRSFFGANATALEGLISARLEGTRDDGLQIRLKLGGGAGLNPHFGAPDWRVVFGIEVFNHRTTSE